MITLGNDTLSGKLYKIDPTRHLTAVGMTGVGKTSLLEHIALQAVQQRFGLALFDVHGDFADRMSLILPSSLKRNLIWYDPSADAVPVFNPLFFEDPENLELAKESVLTMLKALSGSDSAWGNETPDNARAGLDAITELISNPTLTDLYRFVLDDDFRQGLIDRSKNQYLKLWGKKFSKLSAKDQAIKMAPLANKLSKLMRSSILPTIAGKKCLDPLDILNNRRVLICRLSKGKLGEEASMVLYSFIVAMFSIAAMRREKQSVRPPFLIVADEAQNGVHGGRFGVLLAEARKYAISLVTAFQGAYQMPIMDDILTNAGTQIVFNSSGQDAELFAKNWRSAPAGTIYEVSPDEITALSRYECYVRSFERDKPVVRKIIPLPPLKLRRKSNARLIKISLQYWASPKQPLNSYIQKLA